MKVVARRIDFEYEARFARPAFALAQSLGPLLEELYDALTPLTSIRTADLNAIVSGNLSEVIGRLLMPDLGGAIDVTVDKVIARFSHLSDTGSLTAARQCIEAAEQAVIKLFGQKFASWGIAFNCWLHCEDGTDGVRKMLLSHSAAKLDAAALGANIQEHSLRGMIANRESRWDAVYLFELSALPESHLFASLRLNKIVALPDETLSNRATFFEQLLQSIFLQLGLETPAPAAGK